MARLRAEPGGAWWDSDSDSQQPESTTDDDTASYDGPAFILTPPAAQAGQPWAPQGADASASDASWSPGGGQPRTPPAPSLQQGARRGSGSEESWLREVGGPAPPAEPPLHEAAGFSGAEDIWLPMGQLGEAGVSRSAQPWQPEGGQACASASAGAWQPEGARLGGPAAPWPSEEAQLSESAEAEAIGRGKCVGWLGLAGECSD